MPRPDRPVVRLGVSACLLGERVRYDGRHKLDHYISRTLGRYFVLVPLCPEVAIGLGVPRAPIELVGSPSAPRARGVADRALDVTRPLAAYGRRVAREHSGISGYIFKRGSPSCGVDGVPVRGSGRRAGGRGVYADALMAARPLMPVAQEDDLADGPTRENFLERVLVYHRWQRLQAQGMSAARLVEFHSAHKLALMAHGAEPYRRIGRLVAEAGRRPLAALARDYVRQFMAAMEHRATARRHADVLMHIMGYLKKHLTAAEKAGLLESIHGYRLGRAPRAEPLALLRRHFQRHPDDYILRQVYLYPPADEPDLLIL